jgi:pimeloyl-ACP methyl ester carboxylesterase
LSRASLVLWIAVALVATGAVLLILSIHLARQVELRFPPIGNFAEINGARIHYLDVGSGANSDLPPLLFIHGASGNARDLHGAFAEALRGRARMVFVDRPGAGYSQRAGPGDREMETQARYVAGLLEHLDIDRAVVVGHSLGGAVALAMAVSEPERVAGLVLLAPVSHPWPNRDISWYYSLSNLPWVGPAFSNIVAVPAGNLRYASAVRSVFAPNPVADDYENRSGTRLVLRPGSFLANAADVGAAYDSVARLSPRYGQIRVPVAIVTGDSDSTVSIDIHSRGLVRDIAGARLVVLPQTGHMPSYTATALVVAEIEEIGQRLSGIALAK